MKIIKKNWAKKSLSIFALMALLTLSASADVPPPPGGSGGGGPSGSDLPVGAPIDGGLSLLLILGAAYGAKKTLNRNN